MRFLEVRRHSYTKQGRSRGQGSQLSQEGVALARRIGSQLGEFSFVVASPVPRTLETALGMGFAVSALMDMGAGLWEEAQREQRARADLGEAPPTFTAYAELVRAGGPTSALGRHQQRIWREAIDHVPDGAQALVVAHGGLIEPGLVVCFADADHEAWGGALAPCEGARITCDNGRFVDVTISRVDEA
ncbi:MAG TPA: histidine phosphatase family protein [Acidimicrobiales bacterium]|nr:histidine phosphatase family protein [Acidimicrobiales bacterium]